MLRPTTRRDMTDAGALRPQRALDRMPRRVVLRRRTSAPLCTCTPTLLVRHQPASLPRRPSPSLRRPSFRTRPSARSTSTSPSPPTSTRPASLTFRAISTSLSDSSPPTTLVSVPMRRARRRRAGSSSRAVRSTVTRPTAATTSSSRRSSPSPSSSSLSSFSVSFSGRSSVSLGSVCSCPRPVQLGLVPPALAELEHSSLSAGFVSTQLSRTRWAASADGPGLRLGGLCDGQEGRTAHGHSAGRTPRSSLLGTRSPLSRTSLSPPARSCSPTALRPSDSAASLA